MVYCTQCGTRFDGNFCPNCGLAVAQTPPGMPPPVTPPPDVPGLPANIASILCYVVPFVAPILFMVLPPYNREPKIRFDAMQALILDICYLLAQILVGIFNDVSWHAALILHRSVDLLFVIAIAYAAFRCYQNETVILPYVGPMAERQMAKKKF